MRITVLFSLISSCFLCLSCSYFSFETNLDYDNISDYFAPSQVNVYTNEELMDANYLDLGFVEGFVCQEKESDKPATVKDARFDARQQGAKAGANGIIFTKCVELENTSTCLTSVSCYGRLVLLKDE